MESYAAAKERIFAYLRTGGTAIVNLDDAWAQRMLGAARSALRIESGLNDVVLLPIVLVAMVFLGRGGMPAAGEQGSTCA